MIANGIQVQWRYAAEYIELDLDALESLKAVTTTREWWAIEKQLVKYNIRSEIRRRRGGVLELTLHYDPRLNKDLGTEDNKRLWGTSVIKLKRGLTDGTATWRWTDTSIGREQTVRWVCAPGLFKPIKREVVSRIQREQAMFKYALMTYEKRCALTGEETVESLDAAHIIPASKGGAEVIENGILLRADIHRLYDAGKFSIDPSGKVVDVRDVSDAYKLILRKAHIKGKILRRIKNALVHQFLVSNVNSFRIEIIPKQVEAATATGATNCSEDESTFRNQVASAA